MNNITSKQIYTAFTNIGILFADMLTVSERARVLRFKSLQINQRLASSFCLFKTLQRIVVWFGGQQWNRKTTFIRISNEIKTFHCVVFEKKITIDL